MNDSLKPENGVVARASKYSVTETGNRLEQVVKSKGMIVFARINQTTVAQAAGLEMRPTELLIFGDPQTGTALMTEYPLLAIDLPLKSLCWEDENNQVWLAYNSPAYLKKRHGLRETPFQTIDVLIDEAIG